MIFGTEKGNGIWHTSNNSKIEELYDKTEILTLTKISRKRWLGHLYCLKETDMGRKVIFRRNLGKRKAS